MQVGKNFVHPGSRNAAYKWIAAQDGKIHITGQYVKDPNSADEDADGVCLRICQNADNEVAWIGDGGIKQGGNTSETSATIDKELDVKAGDEIFFLVNPEGNNKLDGGKLSIAIAPASGDETPSEVKEEGTTPSDADAADKNDADNDALEEEAGNAGEDASEEEAENAGEDATEDTGDGTEEDAGNVGEDAGDEEAPEDIVALEMKD